MGVIRERSFLSFNRHHYQVLVGIIFGLVVMGCAPRPSPIPQGANKYWYGNIISGEKFSIQIGDNYSSAIAILEGGGFRAGSIFSCSENNGVIFNCSSDSQEVVPLRLRRFGKDGSVFLVTDEDRVVQIVWSFSPVRLP
ncbi:hypothetical protein [Marinicauda salina]|uniref:hypothetical protein n=1 Tax=Marinicauda salina TaxID=2135793 RepID=UPI0011B26440|nr:hypothetical protein [Marinicauda salina]